MSYIGPEHILGALLDDPDSGASRLLEAEGQDVGKLVDLTEHTARADGAPTEAKKPATPSTSTDAT